MQSPAGDVSAQNRSLRASQTQNEHCPINPRERHLHSTASEGRSAFQGGPERRRTSTTLSVIVPAYNEQYLVEASLGRLKILELRRFCIDQVIVVNDGSTDATAEAIARFRNSLEPDRPDSKLQWTWLQHDRNQGKGAAIRTALAHVERSSW